MPRPKRCCIFNHHSGGIVSGSHTCDKTDKLSNASENCRCVRPPFFLLKKRPDCGANTKIVPPLRTFFSRFLNSRFSESLAIVGDATPFNRPRNNMEGSSGGQLLAMDGGGWRTTVSETVGRLCTGTALRSVVLLGRGSRLGAMPLADTV